ncbi:MAG TPA: hypothetical protein VGM42_04075 [Rhodopila sp.]|jgi:hypothetical protein
MRQTILAAATAFVIGGIATGAVLSQAQPAPPPAQQADGAPPPNHGWMGGWRHHPGPEGQAWMHHHHPRPFALIYRQQDRNLAPADVQKIAEGFLLWNGNHSWKVTNVAATADGPIGFDLATQEGSVIAKFTMDPHTGRIQRAG